MVQLAGVWTEVMAESAYIEFLFKLLNRITFRDADSEQGGALKYNFRAVADITPVRTQSRRSKLQLQSNEIEQEQGPDLQTAEPPRGAPAVSPQSRLPQFVMAAHGRFRRPLSMVTGDGRNRAERDAHPMRPVAWAQRFFSRATRARQMKPMPTLDGEPGEQKLPATPTGSCISSMSQSSHGASVSAGQSTAPSRHCAPLCARGIFCIPRCMLTNRPKVLPEVTKVVPEDSPTKADWPTPSGRNPSNFAGSVHAQSASARSGRVELPALTEVTISSLSQPLPRPVGSMRNSARSSLRTSTRSSHRASARFSNEAEASGRSTRVEVIQLFKPSLRPSNSSILRRYSAYGSARRESTLGILRGPSSAISWADQSERSAGKSPLARCLVPIQNLVGQDGHEEPDEDSFSRRRSERSTNSDDGWDDEPSNIGSGGTSSDRRGSRVSKGFLLTAESLKQLVPPNGRVPSSQRLVMGELLVS